MSNSNVIARKATPLSGGSPVVDLAAEINASHDACLLKQAKRQCPHGTWQTWLATNFRGSSRSARAYMQLAKNRDAVEQKRQRSATLSISAALASLPSPQIPHSTELAAVERRLEECFVEMVAAFDAMAAIAEHVGISHQELYDRTECGPPSGSQADDELMQPFPEYCEQISFWRNASWYSDAKARVEQRGAA